MDKFKQANVVEYTACDMNTKEDYIDNKWKRRSIRQKMNTPETQKALSQEFRQKARTRLKRETVTLTRQTMSEMELDAALNDFIDMER